MSFLSLFRLHPSFKWTPISSFLSCPSRANGRVLIFMHCVWLPFQRLGIHSCVSAFSLEDGRYVTLHGQVTVNALFSSMSSLLLCSIRGNSVTCIRHLIQFVSMIRRENVCTLLSWRLYLGDKREEERRARQRWLQSVQEKKRWWDDDDEWLSVCVMKITDIEDIAWVAGRSLPIHLWVSSLSCPLWYLGFHNDEKCFKSELPLSLSQYFSFLSFLVISYPITNEK